MPDFDPKMLLAASLAFFMREKNEKLPEDAFAKLCLLYDENLIAKSPEAERIYLKSLLAANPDPAVFAELRAQVSGPLNRFVMNQWIEVINGLIMLRTAEPDILNMMSKSYENFAYLEKYWDPVKVLLVEVSAAMKFRDLTLEEAVIEKISTRGLDYTSMINTLDMKYFLSEEMKIQLYQHARAEVVLGRDNYPYGNDDEVALREIAKFHVNHPASIYLKTDYGMRNLKLPAAECLQLLQEHSALTNITQLNEYVNLMPAALTRMKMLVNGTRALTFEAAAAETFNGTSILTENYFRKLLSSENKVQLKLVPSLSATTPDKIIASQGLAVAISGLVSFFTSSRSFITSATAPSVTSPVSQASSTTSSSVTSASTPAISTAATIRENLSAITAAPVIPPAFADTHQYTPEFYRPDQLSHYTVSPADFRMYEFAGFTMTSCLVLVMLYNFRPRVITAPLEATGRFIMGLFANKKNDRQEESHTPARTEQIQILQNRY